MTISPKPSLKIRTASAICWIYLGISRDYGLKNIFFRNRTFSICLKQNFVKPHKNFSIGWPIELKFCEISRKFQLSTLKNKKVLFLKNIIFKPFFNIKTIKLCLLTQLSVKVLDITCWIICTSGATVASAGKVYTIKKVEKTRKLWRKKITMSREARVFFKFKCKIGHSNYFLTFPACF